MRKFWKLGRFQLSFLADPTGKLEGGARCVGGAYRDKCCEVSLSDMTDALEVGGLRHDLLHCF